MNEHKKYCSSFHPDSSETVAYHNPLFPAYARYERLSCYPDYAAISHWHTDLEFISVKKGKMSYHVNGELIELSEQSGIVVNSRQLHHGFSRTREECEFLCIILSPELLGGNEWFYQNYVEHITENPSCPYVTLGREGWQTEILERLDRIYDFCENGEDGTDMTGVSYFEVTEAFFAIMKRLYQNLPAARPGRKQESAELTSLRHMLVYVEEHFKKHMTLEEIASAGACCKSKCSLLFKKYLCDTPISYLTKLRLRKSLTALLDSDTCITEIACEYGFGGTSYYCETFRKYYGLSPLRYRKMHPGR